MMIGKNKATDEIMMKKNWDLPTTSWYDEIEAIDACAI